MLIVSESSFAAVDWAVLAGYLLLVVAIGMLAAGRARRAETAGGDGTDFFLAGRSMPMWAVAVSLLATTQSAATFVGGPQQAFAGNLTYFAANIGVLLAVIIVAVWFIPAFYRHNVTSIYELIGHRFGHGSQQLASAMFMVGRVFASGARLFIVAIPFAYITFGDTRPESLVLAIAITTVVAVGYTMLGGIRAVIWTDVLQAVVYVTTIVVALLVIAHKIPGPASDVLDTLRAQDNGSKLTVIDADLSTADAWGKGYTLWAIIFGMTIFNLAAFGTDQDLAQRLLTCRDAKRGSWSIILANVIGLPVVLLFLLMGLLLFVYYDGAAAGGDDRKIFVRFILEEIPVGVRGLMIAGLFAASMSSLDSALNAMASTTIADFVRPRRHKTGKAIGGRSELMASRLAIGMWAIALAGFAMFCVFWQQQSGRTLIDFALGVMAFAYSGLLAVFLTAIFTRRGNATSVEAAMATGFLTVLIMQTTAWTEVCGLLHVNIRFAFPWQMLIATALGFGVCCLGRHEERDVIA